MKFFTLLFILLAATFVFSYSISEDNNKKNKTIYYSNSKCQLRLDKYKECSISEVTEENMEVACVAFQSQKCQNFFKNGVKGILPCSSLDESVISDKQKHYDEIKNKLSSVCTEEVMKKIKDSKINNSNLNANNTTARADEKSIANTKNHNAIIIASLGLILYALL